MEDAEEEEQEEPEKCDIVQPNSEKYVISIPTLLRMLDAGRSTTERECDEIERNVMKCERMQLNIRQ